MNQNHPDKLVAKDCPKKDASGHKKKPKKSAKATYYSKKIG